MTPFVCIGVPYWLNAQDQHIGAVTAIEQSGIATELGAPWITVQPNFAGAENDINAVNRALATTIESYPDHLPLIFAATCISGIGAVKGLARHQPHVLWYDAHGDFNTPETSPSGFLGGMPLAALVGRGNDYLLSGIDLAPVPEQHVTLTDARDLDPEEAVMLRQSQVRHLPDVRDLHKIAWSGTPLYIHFDTDVVNTHEMPAMHYPTQGGPSLADTLLSLHHVGRNANVVGVLFSLWDHTLPNADIATTNTRHIVRELAHTLKS